MRMTPHESSLGHVTGLAEYIDDRPETAREVHVDVFWSPVARAEIVSLDVSQALEAPGIVAIYTARDLHHNKWGTIFHDQPYLASTEVQFVGEALAIIVASERGCFHEAKRRIKLETRVREPVFTVPDAIKQQWFLAPPRSIERGDADQALAKAPHVLKGEVEIAGQEHFYLESQACIAYPGENGAVEIHSSSQHPTEVQHMVAEALGMKFSDVTCVVKRMGGAFGGKESQAGPFAVYAALVARKLGRPARCVITKDDDMIMTGKRNPFHNYYEVGFDGDGRILALKAQLYSDGGAYADLSTSIMERAMLHLDNAYYLPNFHVRGQVCKTNTHPSTAFRGFGGPKGVATIESILEDIAFYLKKDAADVRALNCYRDGQTTPYGQPIDDDVLHELFKDVRRKSDYDQRRTEILAHNSRSNEATWRGLSVTAVKFGISFTTRFLNQGNALVNLHLDGTAQVSTGATEMGQGVNTKIARVVADCFSIPMHHVRVMATSTEKNPNTSATAASSGSDLNGQAALNAAELLRDRLARVAVAVLNRDEKLRGKPIAGSGVAPEIDIEKIPKADHVVFEAGFVFEPASPERKISFPDLLMEAYLNRVPLTAQGFFRYPGIHFDKVQGQGKPFFYFTNGVAASEVSIDRLTGELKVLRTDLLMDLGRPLLDGIDLGQVTGGFVQGMGWVTTENLFYRDGLLVSHSPSTYKIPTAHDVPRVFNCELVANDKNSRNLRGSKAVGEPPLLLALSVWTAAKDALNSARGKMTVLKIPATQEQLALKLYERD